MKIIRCYFRISVHNIKYYNINKDVIHKVFPIRWYNRRKVSRKKKKKIFSFKSSFPKKSSLNNSEVEIFVKEKKSYTNRTGMNLYFQDVALLFHKNVSQTLHKRWKSKMFFSFDNFSSANASANIEEFFSQLNPPRI